MTTMEASGTGQGPADGAQPSSAGPPPVSPVGAERRKQQIRKWAEIIFFVTPALLLFFVFVIYPVTQAGYYSLFNWNGIEELDQFIGLDNYRRAFSDSEFIGAMGNNAFVVAGSMLIQLPVALMIALVLNRKFRFRSMVRVIIFAPYVLAEVIAAVMFALLLQPNGAVNTFMERIGLGDYTQLWLADLDIVMWTVFGVVTWKYIGLAIILFLAGLAGVPDDLQEAAAIDGASWWQVQRRISIPLILPTIRIWVFLSLIGSIQLFDMVWVLTGGGPAGASQTIATYMFQYGFQRSQFGFGSAIAVILFVISLIAGLIYIATVLRRDNSEKLREGR